MEDIPELDSKEIKENDDNSEARSTSSEAISLNVDEREDSTGIKRSEETISTKFKNIELTDSDRISSRISVVEESSITENSQFTEATDDVAKNFGIVTKEGAKIEKTQEISESANIDYTCSFTGIEEQSNDDKLVENIAKLFASIKISSSEAVELSNIKERKENRPEVFIFSAERTESPTELNRPNKNKNLELKQCCPRLVKVKPSTSCPSKPTKIFELVTVPSSVLPYIQEEEASQAVPVHAFLATIDAVLLILEGTLAGAYRIAQNYTGPRIPLLIENTMQSIRLSMETLRTQFSNSDPECFEPSASILRELLTPALKLFGDICPELACSSADFYPALNVPNPEPIPEEQASLPEFSFRSGFLFPKLRVFATHDGFIRVILPHTVEIDLTTDGAICLKDLKDRTTAAISECGNYSGISSKLALVHQHGKVLEMRITDAFSKKNMYGKIGVRGIYFGGTDTPEGKHLKQNGEIVTSPKTFSELNYDFISEIYLSHSTHGPANYEACRTVIQNSTEKTLTDGSVHFCCQDIKITQYKNGEVLVNRNKGALLIWCSPEILRPDTTTEKKGFIKVITPVCRVISTIISDPVLSHEKYFLGNLGSQWLYYNTVEFIASNESHSAGYKEEEEDPTEAPQNDPNK